VDAAALADAMADAAGNLRYGMPTSQKEVLAAGRRLPGAPIDNSADQDVANRYAAGYLFTMQHPDLAPYVMPVANFLHGLFGDDPSVQSYAQEGMNRALVDTQNARRQGVPAAAVYASLAAGLAPR